MNIEFDRKEYLINLKREINELIEKEKDNSLYSINDLISLKLSEEKNKRMLLISLAKMYPEIKNILLYRYQDNVIMNFKFVTFIKELTLIYNNNEIIFDEKINSSWNDLKVDNFKKVYKSLIDCLIDYNSKNISPKDEIEKTNSDYFRINYYNEINKLLDINIGIDSMIDNLVLMYNNNQVKSSFKDIKTPGLKKILRSNHDEVLLKLFNSIQFSEKDISENLNKHLIKYKR